MKDTKVRINFNMLSFGIYFTFFCIYFSPFAFNHSFAGNTDVIVHTSLFREYIMKIQEFFGFGNYGYSFYPSGGTSLFLENMYGQALIFICLKLFFIPDYLATYFLLVLLCTLNGISVNLLIQQFHKNKLTSLVSGFLFSSSCFMLSNVEFLNGMSFFPVVFSFCFLIQFEDTGNKSDFYKACISFALQPFFSGYYFLVGGVFLLALMLINYKNFAEKLSFKYVFISCLVLLISTLPTLIRIVNPEFTTAYNPSSEDFFYLEKFTVKAKSFITSFPRNLVYGYFQENQTTAFRTNNGVLIYILFLIGIFSKFKHRGFLISAGIIAFLISTGSYKIKIFNLQIPSPFSLLFDWNFLGNMFRLPYRFYTITLLVMVIFASFGINKINDKLSNKWILPMLVFFVFLAENIESKVYTSDHNQIITIHDSYNQIKSDNNNPVNLAEFPSSLFTKPQKIIKENEYRREYIYMYRQTYHRQNIINGSASYFPKTRVENNKLMIRISENNHLQELIQKNQLSYITFHKNLVYHPSEWEILTFFEQSNLLNKKYEDDIMVIFSTNI